MAKQKGPVFFTGCSGGITFYEMDGRFYQRRKSSLSRRRVKRDPAFANTMRCAKQLGQASKLAAEAYRTLPKKERQHELYRKLTGQAIQLLKEGMEEALIKEQLQRQLAAKSAPATPAPVAVKVVKRLRIAASKPAKAASLRLKADRLWIVAHNGLHRLTAHAGDQQLIPLNDERCLVPG